MLKMKIKQKITQTEKGKRLKEQEKVQFLFFIGS